MVIHLINRQILHYIIAIMGQTVSKDTRAPPLTYRDCLDYSQLDLSRYYLYRCPFHVLMVTNNRLVIRRKKKRKRHARESALRCKDRTPRSVKRHKLLINID